MTRRTWTPEEDAYMRAAYPETPMAQMCDELRRSDRSIYDRARTLGLHRAPHFIAALHSAQIANFTKGGIATRFRPGMTPWNAGTSYQAGGRSAETQFQPGGRYGQALHNYKPIGSERISKDGYIQRKVNDDMPLQRRWRAVHILIWEAANGPLPAGHAVSFINGDKRDLRLENLRLVSRAEMMSRNTVHNLPPEVVEVVHLRGVLSRRVNRLSKETQ